MAEEKFLLEIVTPQGLVFSEEVDEVTAPGSEGEFGVLPHHVPFVTTLKVGMLTCRTRNQTLFFFVNWSYCGIGANGMMVLADSAEKSDDIDVERARAAMKRAEERLRKAEEIDFHRAEAALERAVTRVQLTEIRKIK
jgi:F-type H+-transporting ATPase subunit epsilon